MYFLYHERIIFNLKIFLLHNIFIYVSNTETFLLVLVGHRIVLDIRDFTILTTDYEDTQTLRNTMDD